MSPSVRDPSSSARAELAELHAAQARAAAIFRAIEEKRLVRPGETEDSVSRAIHHLAESDFGVEKHWHGLYASVGDASKKRGWTFGGVHAGHLVGRFPFSRAERDHAHNRIRPDNDGPLHAPGPYGEARHWILEVHLLDPSGAFGGFYEELLCGPAS
jgi:hypothetical protein